MEIRNILVNVDLAAPSASLLQCAVDLALRHEAELTGFAAASVPMSAVGVGGPDLVTARFEQARARIDQAIVEARNAFELAVSPLVKHSWRSLVDHPTPALIDAAGCCDLILVGSAAGQDSSVSTGLSIGEVVIASGRPVIVVAEGVARIAADKIVVAWKDTREARRAVSDALPFLSRASDVLVAAVHEEDFDVERSELSDIAAWLARHDVKARVDILPPTGTPAETLAAVATSMGADLVVSGGYGHTRLTEWLMGGVTRDLLKARTFSRLFSN